jgi:hypothetical protein
MIVKIPSELFGRAIADLRRPHAFAFERAGFFSTRCSRFASTTLVHCVAYNPVDDRHYLRDDSVGVRIGPEAITAAMTRSAVDAVGQIHVHHHGGPGLPSPSGTDTAELPKLFRSFQNANPGAAHGWMILGESDAWASLALDGKIHVGAPPRVSLVGFPLACNHRDSAVSRESDRSFLSRLLRRKAFESRYDRQSFLGPDSDAIIGGTVIGIIGLGGGGSHIVQQLAHLGFRNFVIVDGDIVTYTNLNRLVGAKLADVRKRRPKVDVAERCIRTLHKDASVTKRFCRWEDSLGDLARCDLVFGSVDSFLARRDLESFCRRNLLPLIDVGMDVVGEPGSYQIVGQVILSMPGSPCMHCMGFLNEALLAEEARKYGAAGGKPQVVWSNGLLSSAAVGVAVDLLTDWSRSTRSAIYLRFLGGQLDLRTDNRMSMLCGHSCTHYPLLNAGDVIVAPL